MKFTTTRAALLPELARVAGSATTKLFPILEHVKLDANGGSLAMTCTDLEIQTKSRCDSSVGEPGTITAPVKKLLSIVKLLPEGSDIKCELSGDKLTVRSKRARYSLATLPSDDFPAFDAGDLQHSVKLPAADLLMAIQKTAFAMAQRDVRTYLNGLALQAEFGTLCAAASNGHQLAVSERSIEDGASMPLVIIPRRSVDELAKALKAEDDGEVTVQAGENSLRVILSTATFYTKLIIGRYPDYNRVVPSNIKSEATVDRDDALNVIKRVAVLASETHSGVRLDLTEDDLRISTQNAATESSEDSIAVTGFRGEPSVFGFSSNYLLDAIGHDEGNDTTLQFGDNGALLIKNDAGGKWLSVIMPMRL